MENTVQLWIVHDSVELRPYGFQEFVTKTR